MNKHPESTGEGFLHSLSHRARQFVTAAALTGGSWLGISAMVPASAEASSSLPSGGAAIAPPTGGAAIGPSSPNTSRFQDFYVDNEDSSLSEQKLHDVEEVMITESEEIHEEWGSPVARFTNHNGWRIIIAPGTKKNYEKLGDHVGYHKVDKQGNPYIYVLGGSQYSKLKRIPFSDRLGHEFGEILIDPYPKQKKPEIMDPFEGNRYTITAKDGTIFSVPCWGLKTNFEQGGKWPFDHCHASKTQVTAVSLNPAKITGGAAIRLYPDTTNMNALAASFPG